MCDLLNKKLDEHIAVVQKITADDELKKKINTAGEEIIQAIKNGNKILLFGNGGSAADCQHIAAEFVGRFKKERQGYPAIALTVDTSILTSVSNDYSFDKVYERQIEALGCENDIAIGISTSGQSKNVLLALKKAKEMKLKTVMLCGEKTSSFDSDIIIPVPSDKAEFVQESHIIIGHFWADYVEKGLELSHKTIK